MVCESPSIFTEAKSVVRSLSVGVEKYNSVDALSRKIEENRFSPRYRCYLNRPGPCVYAL